MLRWSPRGEMSVKRMAGICTWEQGEDEASTMGALRAGKRERPMTRWARSADSGIAGGEALARSEGGEISRCHMCFGRGRRVRHTRCICVRLWVYFFGCR